MKSCACALFLVVSYLSAMAATVEKIGDYSYTVRDREVTITKFNDSGTEAFIPATIDGMPVTAIGDEAFFVCLRLVSVTIPESVTTIGKEAFSCCTRLAGTIKVPKGVRLIGVNAFNLCHSLKAIEVDTSNSDYCSVDGVLFDKTRKTLIQYPGGKAGGYTIPDRVEVVGADAFSDCEFLSSVKIGDKVVKIGSRAFVECKNLTNVVFSLGIASVGDEAFMNCQGLSSVTIPGSVTNIGVCAFLDCTRLTAINVEPSCHSYRSEDGVLFDRLNNTLIQCPCQKAGSYVVPDGVVLINHRAFYKCEKITEITISDSVTTIGNSAFNWCYSLNRVTVGKGVTHIGNTAFRCEGLHGIYFKGSAPSLRDSTFEGAENATIYHLPDTKGWGSTFGGRPVSVWRP